MYKLFFAQLVLLIFYVEISCAQNTNVTDIKTEDYDEKKLESVLKDYSQKNPNENSKEIHKDVTDEELTEDELREFDEFSKAAVKESLPKKLPEYKKDPIPTNLEERKLSENINFMLSPLRKLTDKELEDLLRLRIKESGAEKLYNLEPRIYPFTVKIIKDKEALSLLISISEDIPRLSKLMWLMIATFIVGYFFKRITSNKDQPFVTAIFYGSIRLFIMNCIRLMLIWWLYSKELSPTVKIFKEVFFT